MPSIYDHRKYSEMGVGYEVLPTLTRAEFHDIQRGIENPRAAAKIEKRWLRAMLKAADETTMAEPNKAITKRFVDLIANVRKESAGFSRRGEGGSWRLSRSDQAHQRCSSRSRRATRRCRQRNIRDHA